MSSANTLIDLVGTRLNRADFKTGGSEVTASQEALNDTIRDMLKTHNFTWRIIDPPLSVTLVVNQTVYDMSAAGVDTQDFNSIILNTGSQGTTRGLTELTLKTYLQWFADVDFAAANNPTHYARLDQFKIKLAPKPKTADTLEVYYIRQFTNIVDFAAQIVDIPERAEDVLKLGMEHKLLEVLHEDTRADRKFALYTNALNKLVAEDKSKPNLEHRMRPFSPRTPFVGEYWKSPFVR